ncbi:MAG: TonB-dependent receptor [Asticcacaulis sp.]
MSGAYTDARTKNNLCTFDGDPKADCSGLADLVETTWDDDGSGNLVPTENHDHPQDFIAARKGTRLPITPKVKLSANARYTWDAVSYKPYLQAVVAYQGSAPSDLRHAVAQTHTGTIFDPAALQGEIPSFTTLDLAFGAEFKTWTAELYVDNLSDERAQTARYIECGFCQQRPYAIVMPPRTFGVRLGTNSDFCVLGATEGGPVAGRQTSRIVLENSSAKPLSLQGNTARGNGPPVKPRFRLSSSNLDKFAV